ncbi:hypothetical protein BJ166DRAFT_586250 [Pestalotiopsis sp. NC0098]|nr:hypothetical protein BJ166DRAFT_586250 [Pestalotiopsis sp. NC0098]
MSRQPPTTEQSWMLTQRWVSQFSATEEFKVLDDLVNKVDATASGAVEQIIALANTSRPGLVDYHVSLSVLELAQRLTPDRHERLVDFMWQLHKQTVTDPTTGEPLQTHEMTLFRDLPSFGYTELETWDEYGGGRKDPRDADMPPEQKQRFANLNAFLAQLTQNAANRENMPDDVFQPMDKSLRAIWAIKQALEDQSRRPAEIADTAAMRAACMWFVYASGRLMANVRDFRTFPEHSGAGVARSREEYASRGYKGYTLGRWQLWQQSLEEAWAASEDTEMKALIGDALMHMRRAEAEG